MRRHLISALVTLVFVGEAKLAIGGYGHRARCGMIMAGFRSTETMHGAAIDMDIAIATRGQVAPDSATEPCDRAFGCITSDREQKRGPTWRMQLDRVA